MKGTGSAYPSFGRLHYSAQSLDRAAHFREDPAWIGAAVARTETLFVPYWRGSLLIEQQPRLRAVLTARPVQTGNAVFLGLFDGVAAFAVDLSEHDEPMEVLRNARGAFVELRSVSSALPAEEAGLLATAKGLLCWQSRHRFCGVCGAPCGVERAGHLMRCKGCTMQHFPRIDPAVIMLVHKNQQLLLGQSHRFPVERNFFSTLAGFVEPGESLEEAVRREVLEEVGIQVGTISYVASQPWPFPSSLMLGFRAEASNEEIVLDMREMRAARWFSKAEIADRESAGFSLPPPDSIARRLIEEFLSEI